MPLAQLPAIDVNACSGWTEQDRLMYNRLQFYIAKMQVERRKTWITWNRFFGKIKWTPNMGKTMRSVTKEPSPHVRQFAFPNPIGEMPKKDVIDVRERSQDEVVYRHRFESLALHWEPNFVDFLTDHVDAAGTDIMEKQERFQDVFERGRVFHRSPFFGVADGTGASIAGVIPAPIGEGNAAGTNGKTTAFLQAQSALIGPKGYLSMEYLNKVLTIMENDHRVPAFSGSNIGEENKGLTGKFGLVLSSEAFNHFTLDPWLLANKNCSLDIVNGRFQGSLFGRITCIIEDMPMRMRTDGTFPAPETRELGADAYNKGETIPNSIYTSLDGDNGSPYEFAFMLGAEGYDTIQVGPPPSQFASNGMPKGFGKMQWNGELILSKNILVPCVGDDGTVAMETNVYGELMKFFSQTTYGIRAKQPRNVLPIMFKRKRGQ